MLPIVTEDLLNVLKAQLEASPDDWKRSMLNKLREENPEVNTLLLEVAQTMNLGDPKSIILGGFLVYSALELAERAEEL
ncbi:MAG: hypothetical protein QE263_05225 [Vampirovibrionales bacterium]|jgi:hypothetical protein|nr:hypothetical protein [Vampirovibrionales bacterium]